jgi:hypothetical protein
VAGNWFPALEQIALQQHWKLVTDMHATCTWTATMTISTIRPDVVITSDLPDTGSATHPKDDPEGYADIGTGMAKYWTQPEDHGISVVPDPGNPRDGLHRAGLRGQVRRLLREV